MFKTRRATGGHTDSVALHSTNYENTFIAVAPDCSADEGKPPPESSTVASLTFRMLHKAPYSLTSDEVIFDVYAQRKKILNRDRKSAREELFSKGQACLRASALGKTYGWGIHFDSRGLTALYGCESAEYTKLAEGHAPDGTVVTVKAAMRSKRKG